MLRLSLINAFIEDLLIKVKESLDHSCKFLKKWQSLEIESKTKTMFFFFSHRLSIKNPFHVFNNSLLQHIVDSDFLEPLREYNFASLH